MDSLEELGAEGLIPVDLMPRVVHEYDQVVARVVSDLDTLGINVF